MRRALLVLCAVAAGLGLAPAAPATAAPATTEPPPRAVDFALPVTVPAGARAAAARPWTSAVLRAPKRFDLLGLRWGRSAPEHVGAEVRTRRLGRRWSRWTALGEAHAAHGSDPAWAGGADELQVRLEHRVRGLRVHFVNTTGTATAAARRRSASRPAAAGPRARAAAAQPAIVPRAAWGADQCVPRDDPSLGAVHMAFVHHTVGTNDYTPQQSPAVVLAICRYHRNANGWDDVGYNFLVDKYGTIFEGRAGGIDQAVVGAQAQGYNAVSTGVANLGTHTAVPQTKAALGSIARLLAWKLPLHGAPVTGTVTVTSAGGETNRHASGKPVTFERISGHRDGNATSCPGDALFAQLPGLRALTDVYAPDVVVPPAPKPAQIALAAASGRVAYPAPVQLSGRMIDTAGHPVAGSTVAVQMLTSRGAWVTIRRTTTGLDGAFAADVPTGRNRSYRAVRDAPGIAVVSPAVAVTVAPAITARAAGRVRAGGRVVVSGTIAPRRSRVVLTAARRLGDGRLAPAVRLRVRARDGRFRARVPLRRAGRYRVRVAFRGDRLNAPGRARHLVVRAVRPAAAAGPDAPPAAPPVTGGVVAGPAAR